MTTSDWWVLGMAVVLVASGGLVAGCAWGNSLAERSAIVHAEHAEPTAHHMRGKFYYIVPESRYVELSAQATAFRQAESFREKVDSVDSEAIHRAVAGVGGTSAFSKMLDRVAAKEVPPALPMPAMPPKYARIEEIGEPSTGTVRWREARWEVVPSAEEGVESDRILDDPGERVGYADPLDQRYPGGLRLKVGMIIELFWRDGEILYRPMCTPSAGAGPVLRPAPAKVTKVDDVPRDLLAEEKALRDEPPPRCTPTEAGG